MAKPVLTLLVQPQTLAICRLAAGSSIPTWALDGDFVSITRTPDELSIVCAEQHVPAGLEATRGWRSLRVEGTLDFSLTGILAGMAAPLSIAGISIFAVSTYDTDYILVEKLCLGPAIDVLRRAGYQIRE